MPDDLKAMLARVGTPRNSADSSGKLERASSLLAKEFSELRFNLLTGVVEGDVSVAQARLFLESELRITPKRDIVTDAIEIVARSRAHDPLIDHINALPKWDGTERAEKWLITYAGAEDNNYTKIIGQRFLIGCIARGLIPGCKLDTFWHWWACKAL